MMNQAEAHANLPTKNKVRIHAKYVVLERVPTVTQMRQDPNTGLVVPTSEEYKHHEGPELAVNWNYIGISKAEFDEQWAQLGRGLWHKMQSNGLSR